MKHCLQKNIPRFFYDFVLVALVYGVYKLVGLLYQVGANAFVSLRLVPRTAVFAAQRGQNFNHVVVGKALFFKKDGLLYVNPTRRFGGLPDGNFPPAVVEYDCGFAEQLVRDFRQPVVKGRRDFQVEA